VSAHIPDWFRALVVWGGIIAVLALLWFLDRVRFNFG
jgi:hypothetical protein